jgi:hypothetical protein
MMNLGGGSITSAAIIAALGFTPADAGAVNMGDGTVSLPGMPFGSDLDTGFYRIAANTVGVAAGGVNVASMSPTLVTVGAFSTDVSTGYMGFSRTDPGYWFDFNEQYTDVASNDAKHFFHMYGYVETSAVNPMGQITGYYAHLDGGASMVAGKTMGDVYPLRGNGTWGVAGTLSNMRGAYAGARVVNDNSGVHLTGNGVITDGYGGFFEACNETTGTGTITNAYGVRADVRNTDGGTMTTAHGVYSYVRSQTNGGGITTGFGVRVLIENNGPGIGTYYGLYIDSTVTAAATRYAIYSAGTAKSWHSGSFAIGDSSASSTTKFHVHDSALAGAGIFRSGSGSFTGDVLRLQADRAASSAYDFLSVEADVAGTPATVARIRGDGLISSTTTAGIGYGTGAGGTATQSTDKSTAVTIDKLCGRVTTNNANLNAGASVSFTVNSSPVVSTDAVVVWLVGGSGTAKSYRVSASGVTSGAFDITIENFTGGNLAETLIIGFAVFRTATT